jgi:hypothetical protein
MRQTKARIEEEAHRMHRRRFQGAVNHGYAEARRSPGWERTLAERAEWDYALTDGLAESRLLYR